VELGRKREIALTGNQSSEHSLGAPVGRVAPPAGAPPFARPSAPAAFLTARGATQLHRFRQRSGSSGASSSLQCGGSNVTLHRVWPRVHRGVAPGRYGIAGCRWSTTRSALALRSRRIISCMAGPDVRRCIISPSDSKDAALSDTMVGSMVHRSCPYREHRSDYFRGNRSPRRTKRPDVASKTTPADAAELRYERGFGIQIAEFSSPNGVARPSSAQIATQAQTMASNLSS
jgi:hypothetical protein